MRTLNVTRLAEWGAVLTFVITGTLWLGSLNNRVAAGETQLKSVSEDVKTTPAQIAVLQSQMSEVRDVQRRQDEKLDRILGKLQ